MDRIVILKCGETVKFHKNLFQTFENMGAQNLYKTGADDKSGVCQKGNAWIE